MSAPPPPVPISSDWSQYATQEPPELLWFERVNYVSVNLGLIGYGFLIVATAMCVYYLFKEKNWERNWRWLAFVLILFGCGTTNISMNMRFNQYAWIDYRQYPGGPLMFLLQQQSAAIQVGGNAVAIIIGFFTDALLIYRVHVVYRRWWILVVPILSWLAMQVLGGFFVAQTALPASSLWANGTLNFALPYFAIAMSLNILLTLMLVTRLLYMRSQIANALGSRHGDTYTHVAAMILESAAPFGIISLIFLVLYSSKNTAALLFVPLLAQTECISSIVIILRVARGRTWTNETISETNLSTLQSSKHRVGVVHRTVPRFGDHSMSTFKVASADTADTFTNSKESEVNAV
ncbi:hypothetical protein CPB83DRAFT_798319 [Crepidotus variabilis]|uniref:Uncharacterized protein n=1 Tax=Crepidotus variabilis TaxID=179855 RepID=A0A9P6E894_9AGAR|nr:hypothetical protein CPB83DRAFT_798319 [Crepidotus variabilis]